jgi:hypothetical protein
MQQLVFKVLRENHLVMKYNLKIKLLKSMKAMKFLMTMMMMKQQK